MAGLLALGAVTLLGGCGIMSDGSAAEDALRTIRSVDDARQQTRNLSSALLDTIAVQGRTSEPGPRVGLCEEDPERERLFKMGHTWSLSRASLADLEQGMDRLRQELPRQGWELVGDGIENNANRSPYLTFDNTDIEYSVNVSLASDPEPMLVVTVVSACFSTPEGESPRGQY
ncbi:hypothetical protein D7319_14570 [Streptomyces radicis]|uniref:Lipoprotein n=2 Tax=Streptomyces radicis TaxID=1750517 RepID=A0A3A9W5Y8_9ACTN|nr:hypothetical protein D7319_14570 [Streptomyces radicis]RKN21773.1 hypothetical protein D7318_15525 [Streptomyces radicis]